MALIIGMAVGGPVAAGILALAVFAYMRRHENQKIEQILQDKDSRTREDFDRAKTIEYDSVHVKSSEKIGSRQTVLSHEKSGDSHHFELDGTSGIVAELPAPAVRGYTRNGDGI